MASAIEDGQQIMAANILCPAGGVIFVKADAPAGGDGTSWETAYNDLQDALAVTDPCQIWVAAGIYKPTSSSTDRTASFQLASGVKLYGGFAGTELSLTQRDWIANQTILSGDIDGNDTAAVGTTTANIVGGNSYHIVRLDGTTPVTALTVIDGVIITGGLADDEGTYPHGYGAGLFCDGQVAGICSPSLENVRFYGNKAQFGGALYAEGYGGESSPTLTNVAFRGNEAKTSGGALFSNGENGGSSPSLINVLFFDNRARFGGAVYSNGFQGSSSPTVINGTFANNVATVEGGAMLNDGVQGQSLPQLTSVVMWGNTAAKGSQIYNDDATPTLTNSIVQQRNGAGIVNFGSSSVSDGGGNLNSNPLFVDAAGGDLHLGSGSPAMDSGDNSASSILTDLDGGPRIFNGTVDMGAYEASIRSCPAGGRIYVNGDNTPGGDGTSWGLAFAFLQDALAVSEPCQIWVAKGVYQPSPNQNRAATFSVSPGVALYGGFIGSETSLEQRDWTANPTIVSGDLDGNDDANNNGTIDVGEEPTGNNSYNIFTLDGTASSITFKTVIDGFTIQGGLADSYPNDSGAGLRCYAGGNGQCRPILHNLTFIGNKAVNGGAMLNHGQEYGTASPSMRNVAFRHNVATDKGGAIYNLADGPNSQAAPYIMRAAFTDNRSTGTSVYSGGGAIYNQYDLDGSSSGALYLANGLFLRNSAAGNGGAIYNRAFDANVTPYMAFVTMADNSADKGGAIFLQAIGSPYLVEDIRSSILWNNTASEDGAHIYVDGPASEINIGISFSLVGGGDAGIVGSTAFSDGTGNIDADPRFRDGDRRLGTGSPAIDAAEAGNLPEDLADWPDIDGNMRIVDDGSTPDTGTYRSNFLHNAVPDMGAYEYNSQPCPTVSRLYVDKDAGGGSLTGESWADAYVSASNGLEAAQLCDNISEVWVAEGVYTPPSARASFVLRPGVALYGEFNGSETSLAGRDLAATSPTILSGDVDGDDLNSDGNQIAESPDQIQGTNSSTVVRLRQTDTMTESNRIDGFTITAGNGAADGAGLYCFSYNTGCDLTLANLTVVGNYATTKGGGLHIESWYVPSDVTLTDVTISGNRTGGQGGGLYWKSHATGTGTGEESRLVIRNGRFKNNQADSGGAVYIHGNSGVALSTLTNMTFSGNSASGAGGAIYIGDKSGPNGTFNLTLTNVTAHNNTAGTTGGAIMGEGDAGATVNAELDNVILWGNQDSTGQNEVNLVGQSSMSLDTSIVQGGDGGIVDDGSATPFSDGTGNLNADPLFVNAASGNLRLQSTSPAVDAGNNAAIAGTALDLDGNTRIANGTVDMGAYEVQPARPPQGATVSGSLYADGNGNGQQDGGEKGIPKATVTLSDASRSLAVKRTAVTDAAGAYIFNDVPPGEYSLGVDIPGQKVIGLPQLSISVPNSDPVTIPPVPVRVGSELYVPMIEQ